MSALMIVFTSLGGILAYTFAGMVSYHYLKSQLAWEAFEYAKKTKTLSKFVNYGYSWDRDLSSTRTEPCKGEWHNAQVAAFWYSLVWPFVGLSRAAKVLAPQPAREKLQLSEQRRREQEEEIERLHRMNAEYDRLLAPELQNNREYSSAPKRDATLRQRARAVLK